MADLLKSKNILIIGAGEIGRRTITRCVEEGASVTVWDRRIFALEFPDRVIFKNIDIRNTALLKESFLDCENSMGHIDAVVNTAGIVKIQKFDEITINDWYEILETNLTSAFFVMQAAIPHLAKTAGSMVNIGSISGIRGEPEISHYVASKFGLVGLTQALAIECGSLGVRVNIICPGAVDSRMNDLILIRNADGQNLDLHHARRLMASDTPLQRLCTTNDVANAVLYFASDLSQFVTGQALLVTGGKA